nr:hypothetical protein GCM10025730_54180 [Promicromonospora thailandica]
MIARDGLDLAGGERFDVQGGGCDLLFPHHEMSTSHLRVLCANAGGDAPRGPSRPAPTCTPVSWPTTARR